MGQASIGQYTSNIVKLRYFCHTEYNLELLFYALKYVAEMTYVYCDSSNFTIRYCLSPIIMMHQLESLLLIFYICLIIA